MESWRKLGQIRCIHPSPIVDSVPVYLLYFPPSPSLRILETIYPHCKYLTHVNLELILDDTHNYDLFSRLHEAVFSNDINHTQAVTAGTTRDRVKPFVPHAYYVNFVLTFVEQWLCRKVYYVTGGHDHGNCAVGLINCRICTMLVRKEGQIHLLIGK